MRVVPSAVLSALALCLVACGTAPSTADINEFIGPNPKLVAPNKRLIPTVNVADAQGWPAGQMP